MLNIVGGCCGTTDEHIRKIAEMVEPIEGLFMAPRALRDGSNGLNGNYGNNGVNGNYGNGGNHGNNGVNGNYGNGGNHGNNDVHGSHNSQHSHGSHPSSQHPSSSSPVFSAILAGKSAEAAEATKEAIAAGQQPQDIINGQMIRAMGEVGQRFQDGKAFVPQLLMAGRAMKAALEILKPLMAGSSNISLGKVVIGTVKGDLHDIGKNLVASMLEGCGFEVVNIGIDVSADTFIDEIRKNKPDILCMSALLTTTMGYMKEVIDALKEAGLRDQVKVMVGGAPVSQAFADEIGADGYSDNANTAVAVAKQLLGVK
jgi:corrinoid protein of di/trimethylamine methyltransferase